MHSWQETNERLKVKVSGLEDQLKRLSLYLDKLEAERDALEQKLKDVPCVIDAHANLEKERDQLIERLARLEGTRE